MAILLTLTTNGAVNCVKSQPPDLLNLDLVYADIDARWDESMSCNEIYFRIFNIFSCLKHFHDRLLTASLSLLSLYS